MDLYLCARIGSYLPLNFLWITRGEKMRKGKGKGGPNYPSKTGKPSGKGRGNIPKGKGKGK